jgi:hypothetical protein
MLYVVIEKVFSKMFYRFFWGPGVLLSFLWCKASHNNYLHDEICNGYSFMFESDMQMPKWHTSDLVVIISIMIICNPCSSSIFDDDMFACCLVISHGLTEGTQVYYARCLIILICLCDLLVIKYALLSSVINILMIFMLVMIIRS